MDLAASSSLVFVIPFSLDELPASDKTENGDWPDGQVVRTIYSSFQRVRSLLRDKSVHLDNNVFQSVTQAYWGKKRCKFSQQELNL